MCAISIALTVISSNAAVKDERNIPNGGLRLKICFSVKHAEGYLNALFRGALWSALRNG